MSKRWLSAFVPIVVLLVSLAHQPGIAHAGEGAFLLNAGANCSGATTTMTFSWQSAGSGTQWLDLSLSSNGFLDGTYLSAGPLSPGQSSLTWPGIIAGRAHFWRITSFGSDGWTTSATGTFTPCTSALPPASPIVGSGLEAQLLQSQNADRAAAGLAPLAWDDGLASAARTRALDMTTNGYFAHTSPSGDSAFSILSRMGISYSLAGENLARNNYPDGQTVQAAENGFMESSTHRANVLEPKFTRAGVAVSYSGEMKYFVVIYSSP